MNADHERRISGWLATRDPGDAPATLRAVAARVPETMPRSAFPAFDAAMTRLFGRAWIARPALVLVAALLLALVIAVIGAALVLRLETPPIFPPRGLIAYAGPEGVQLVEANGNRVRTLTKPGVIEHAPRWSADGRILLLARTANPSGDCSGDSSIVLYDVGRESERAYPVGRRALILVEWSPSERQVGYIQWADGCQTAKRGVLDLDSGSVTTSAVTASLPAVLRWTTDGPTAVGPEDFEVASADGRYVALAGNSLVRDPGSSIAIRDTQAGTTLNLGRGGAPAWSPNGQALAFIQQTDEEIEIDSTATFRDRLALTVAGTSSVRVLGDVFDGGIAPGGAPTMLTTLAWTPDGRGIYWIDLQGGHIVDVTTGQVIDLPAQVDGCSDLQWQPVPVG
jgi:dipeptidyl aminopeptidase/acylaminoacyl peptidase